MRDSNADSPSVKSRIGRPPTFDWTDLADNLERLGSVRDVASFYGCAERTIRKELDRIGIEAPRRSRERIDFSHVEEDYERLRSTRKVAVLYGCTKAAVGNALRRRGVILSTGGVTQFDMSNVVADYDRLGSPGLVAQEYGCSASYVSATLNKMGVVRTERLYTLTCISCGDEFLARGSRTLTCGKPECYRMCDVIGCDKMVYCKDMCAGHDRQARSYGFDDAAALSAFFEPGCTVCGDSDELHVDHDHSHCPELPTCGKCNRGPLCERHNLACGLLRDNSEEAESIARYLRSWQESHLNPLNNKR